MPNQLRQPGIFIAGTDTNVGKTVVTAALGLALQQTGAKVGVMKPVETGSAPDKTNSDVYRLRNVFASCKNVDVRNVYSLPQPVAPLEAARTAQQGIDVDAILNACRTFAVRHDYMLVEGAGGILVPLTETHDVCDLIRLLGLPCLIVGRTCLGSINHTRLTLRGLREAGIPVFGILLNHMDTAPEEQQASTVKLIRELSDAPVLGPLPFQPHMDSQWEGSIRTLANHSTIREVARMVQESN